MIAETEDDLIKRLNEWKDFVNNRDVRINMNKTKVMISGQRQKVMHHFVHATLHTTTFPVYPLLTPSTIEP